MVRHDFGLRGRYCCQVLGGMRVFEMYDKLSDTLSGIEFEVVLFFVSGKRGWSLGFNLSKAQSEVNKVVNLIKYHCLTITMILVRFWVNPAIVSNRPLHYIHLRYHDIKLTFRKLIKEVLPNRSQFFLRVRL